MIKKPISADSHITEPPNCYSDYIDAKYRERAPKMKRLSTVGDAFVIDGMSQPVPMGLVAAAGKEPSKITTDGVAFEDLWRSGWDSTYRVADQEKDGVAAEIIYPTVGMLLCNHPIRLQEGVLRCLQPVDCRILRPSPDAAVRYGASFDANAGGRRCRA
jgi:hypothetical protein